MPLFLLFFVAEKRFHELLNVVIQKSLLIFMGDLLIYLVFSLSLSLYIYIFRFTFIRCFYPKWLTVHSGYTYFLSVYVFPGNRTHNLCAANAMLNHRATGIYGYTVHIITILMTYNYILLHNLKCTFLIEYIFKYNLFLRCKSEFTASLPQCHMILQKSF